MKKNFLILIFSVQFLGCAVQPAPNFNKLADAIHHAENGRRNKGEAYGIHSVKYRNASHAREICIRTVIHKYRAWDRRGSFLKFLASKYCPKNSSVWFKNVSFFYGREL